MSNYRKTMADALREMYPLDEGTIDKVKEIASKKQAMKIDGVMVDSFTASAISQIYDRVNDANKKKMDSLPITKLANLAFKMMQKNEFVPEEADLDEETQIDEATMSSSQIARLKKAYEPMRDKKISTSNADKLSAMMDKVGKDKEALIQLFKADIPFVSQSAVTKLITKHNMKGAEINKLREEADLDEGTKQVLAHGGKGKYKVTKDGDKIEIKFGGKVVGTADFDRGADSFFVSIKGERGQKSFDDAQAIADYFAKNKITEEVDLDEDSLDDFQDFARLYGGGDEIYVVTQGKDSNSLKVIGIEKDPNKAKKIRDRAKGARASLWGQMKSSQKVLKLKIGDPVSFEDSKNKLSFIEEVDLDEAKYTYKAATFNGNTVVGTGSTEEDAIKDAKNKAKELGSTLRKRISMKKEEVDLDEGKMSQLHQYMQDKKSPEEIAKLMKLDVKTIKSLMSSHHPEDVEEASAYADARRSMSKDKDFSRKDSADDDTDASDDDVKGASKNIIMQMRKAQSLSGNFAVEFGDGKKVKIPAKMAVAVQQKYNAMKKPVDKEKFQARIGKSYKDMLSALKEELQPKKESILERMNRKLKENKHG
jgi:hypothetical protein